MLKAQDSKTLAAPSSHTSVYFRGLVQALGGSEKPESTFSSPRSIGSPRTSGTTPSGANKRSWDDHKSEHIFDYFPADNTKSSTSQCSRERRWKTSFCSSVISKQKSSNPDHRPLPSVPQQSPRVPQLMNIWIPVCHNLWGSTGHRAFNKARREVCYCYIPLLRYSFK